MILSNIDTICRRWLLERNLPIHYYFEALMHSSTVVRELSYDTLQIINSANLPVGDYGEVELPDDFVDDLAVCIPAGQSLLHLPKQDWITPLRIHSTTTGEFDTYTQVSDDEDETVWGLPSSWVYYWNVDEYGSSTGRQFGNTGGTMQGYKVVKERRQIQMTENFIGTNVVLLYLSDGQRPDNASQVDVLAIKCIQTYIDWQRSPNATNEKSPEARTFYNQKRRLKSLLNPLTKIDIMNIIHSAFTASIKS